METKPAAKCDFSELARAKGIDLNDELTKGFAARRIRRKARQLVGRARLTPSDQDEIEQDLRICLLKSIPKFNPLVSHWHVFVTTVIERGVTNILEARRAQKREHNHNVISLSTQVKDEEGELVDLARMIASDCREELTGRYTITDQESWELVQDVNAVLSRLPDDLRDLCERLKSDSLAQISRDLGIPRSTLYGKVCRLRAIFMDEGF